MEKIKITLSNYTYNILLKDMESFFITKEGKELNKNDFFNRLIANYADEYNIDNKEQTDKISTIVNKYTKLDELDQINLSNDLIKSLRENLFFHNVDDKSVIVNIKPTKVSEDIITYLLSHTIRNQSISSYFRQMFDSYANLTQNMRERIIFKNNFELLIKSIEKKRKVFVTLRNSNKDSFVGSLYAIGDSKEEMYNYCLFELENKISTVRLAKIASVKILNEPASFDPNNIPLFEFQTKHCIQTKVSTKDFDPVKVYLNKDGVRLYEKMYVFRPTCINVEGEYYYFVGSHEQILMYFKRFGRSAIILEPDYLRIKLENYYKDSYYAYNHVSRKKNKTN